MSCKLSQDLWRSCLRRKQGIHLQHRRIFEDADSSDRLRTKPQHMWCKCACSIVGMWLADVQALARER